eukprot:CAMPEP_0171640812 /NCGR_PEP_ID=MMETSP0990-20121206/30765_1 /TAXON_ID=483369 /ORGANISM="non described non described, Strain CCMP2098" /LENGTH=241 /DNA_ID=CAMNT_0012215279 /DNA_START=80 /DNA_END=805 /DNA_ORIENTATION=+
MVYGGMDGIITTFAIVCAASGARKDESTIVTMGVANLIADAISMGMGDYISDQAEQNFAILETSKKRKLLKAKPEDQKKALITAFKEEHGVSKDDAEELVARMSKYEDLYLEQLVREVEGVEPPDEKNNSMMKGLVTAVSFVVFGSVPLLVFLLKAQISSVFGWHAHSTPLVVSTLASAITMFTLGAIAGTFTEQNLLKSGFTMAAHGLLAAYTAFAIGHGMEIVYHIEGAAAALGAKADL